MQYMVYAYPSKRALWTGRHWAGPFNTKIQAVACAKEQRARRVYGRVTVTAVVANSEPARQGTEAR